MVAAITSTPKPVTAGRKTKINSSFLLGAVSPLVTFEPALFDLGIVVIGVAYVAKAGTVGGRRLIMSIAYLAASIPAAMYPALSGVNPVRYYIVEILFVVGFLLLAELCLHDEKVHRDLLAGYVFGAVLACLVTLATYVAMPDAGWIYRDEFRTRLKGTFKDPNVLGPFLIFPICALLFARSLWPRIPIFGRSLARRMAALATIVPCLYLTLSRGALAVGGLAVVLVVIITPPDSGTFTARHRRFLLLLCGAALVVLFALSDSLLPTNDVNSRLTLQDYDSQRFEHLGIAIDETIERPWGLGPGVFDELHGNNPHNLFLGKATDVGFLPAIMLTGFFLWATWKAGRSWLRRREDIDVIIFAVLASHLVLSSVIYSHHWRHYYLLAIVAVARSAHVLRSPGSVDQTSALPPASEPTPAAAGFGRSHRL